MAKAQRGNCQRCNSNLHFSNEQALPLASSQFHCRTKTRDRRGDGRKSTKAYWCCLFFFCTCLVMKLDQLAQLSLVVHTDQLFTCVACSLFCTCVSMKLYQLAQLYLFVHIDELFNCVAQPSFVQWWSCTNSPSCLPLCTKINISLVLHTLSFLHLLSDQAVLTRPTVSSTAHRTFTCVGQLILFLFFARVPQASCCCECLVKLFVLSCIVSFPF